MNNRQKRFFNVASEVSKLGNFKRARVGAVVVEGNRIISTGHNSSKTNPLQCKYNAYRDFQENEMPARVHAEIAALAPLMRENIDWRHISLYVYRELRDGTRSCARPCEACSRLIRKLGIRFVYYTDWDGNYVKEEFLNES